MNKPRDQETFGAELEFPTDAPPAPAMPADARKESLIGTLVANRYVVHRQLGHGGMGTVYEAEHVQLRKRVALKVLHGHMSVKPEVQARFEREAVAAGRITHPGVVAATDFGRLADGSFYLVLEHVDGTSLADVLEKTPLLPPDRAFRIMVQICSALSAAHAQGIVHRDLKPDNIMLISAGDDDVVKVLDFGIAKVQMEDEDQGEGKRLTRAGLVFGTPEYMSPEQARGAPVDRRADLYSLGMIGYEMLCGRSAFRADDMMAILTAQMADDPPPLPESVPAPLSGLIYRLLEKDPGLRPQSADELFEELTVLAGRLGFAMPTPKTGAARRFFAAHQLPFGTTAMASIRALSMRPAATGGLPLWLALLVVLVLGAGAAYYYFGVQQHGVESLRSLVSTAPPEVREPAPASTETQLLVLAREGDRDALGELRRLVERDRSLGAAAASGKIPPAALSAAGGTAASAAELGSRQVERLLALGRGYSVIRHHSGALSAYGDALKLDPHLVEDPGLLVDVRVALGERDAGEEGLELALELGAYGADMVYDIWTVHRGQPGMTPIVARAMKLVKGGDLRSVATPALEIAMDLERARVCAEYRALLPRAIEHADERSLSALKALRSRRGCGKNAGTDCFPCIRPVESQLEDALAAASVRPAPRFLEAAQEASR